MTSPSEIATRTTQVADAVGRVAVVTPVDELLYLAKPGRRVLAKREDQQTTGSFKIRGATAKLAGLDAEQLARGVVAASTGNHGLAVAHAGTVYGTPVTVFVPDNAVPSKLAKIEAAGARLEVIAGNAINAERAARSAAAKNGKVYISPYNDSDVVAGQGTIGRELAKQVPGPFTLVVSVGGGGLVSGTAAALAGHRVRVIGTSPEVDAAMASSVVAGRIVDVDALPTVSDGTAGNLEPDALTLALCAELVDEWVLQPESAIEAALATHRTETGEEIEGSAALALATAASLEVEGDIVVIICGGNT